MLNIFKIGDMEYPEKLNKPVRYDANFLKDIASKTGVINITKEHSNDVIGVLENFIYENGYLKAKEPDGFDLKGKGFSPVFDCDLIDEGSYYRPVNGLMSEIGLTENPRSSILYNSIESNSNVGVQVSEALETVIKEKEELQKRIGVLENQSKTYKELLQRKDDEISSIKEGYKDVDSRLAELDSLQEKAGLYDELQANIRNDLIDEICGDNDSLKEAFQNLDVNVLQALKENPTVVRQGNGIPPNVAEGYDIEGSLPSNNDGKEDVYTEEEFLKDFEATGW